MHRYNQNYVPCLVGNLQDLAAKIAVCEIWLAKNLTDALNDFGQRLFQVVQP